MKTFAWAALIAIVFSSMTHAAQVEKELEGIKKKMEKERQGIRKARKEESSVLQRLGQIEEALDHKNKELKGINSKMDFLSTELQKKEQEIKKLSLSLEKRKSLLKKRALALYKWQRGGSPFILLESSSVSDLIRQRHHLQLVLDYDQRLIGSLSEEAGRQETLKAELAQKRRDIDQQRGALVGVKESIRVEREKKKEILASLRREKEARTQALKDLEQAAQRLQKMMDEISRKALVKGREPPGGVGLEAMRGKLDYPVRGALMAAFGKVKHPEFSAELFRKGIDIEAPYGEQIRAVEGGRVIFADRFPGYGKMMVVDHGDRYYTVYAHLSELLKKNGETVRKGEPIALVGDSDSLAGARLYFEIRKDGKPLDPVPWFKKQ
ncbi:MAG TPA: peptidoglycan DD-metalloendopeptidase family protein [Candidatus Binatia bacterium]|jgi:septal ring factor EnvC (AmiA/AmiB activator)|nr:peptidoglycan DD-metalloendopeptidase family protein [Candidatus Binatia bacterium]